MFGAQGHQSIPAAAAAMGSGGPHATLAASVTEGPSQSILGATGEAPDVPVVKAEGTNPSPALLSSEGRGTAPTMSQEQSGMPDDIRRWLEHLERTEKMRNTLAASQMMQAVSEMSQLQAQDLTGMMGDGDGDDSEEAANRKVDERANRYAGNTDSMRRAWIDLANQFHSVPPPGECMGMRSTYDQVLSNTGSMMLEIINAVKSASNNRQSALQTLMSMQGQSNDRIDRPAKETDAMVEQVCSRYSTRKWFDIKSDIGSDVMSKLGF
jgi:hypothetical protein